MRSIRQLSDLSGRGALITGGGGHLGSAIAAALAELGASVAVLDQNDAAARRVADHLGTAYHVDALPLVVDLAAHDAVRDAVNVTVERFGGLDILVSCAALAGASYTGLATSFDRQTVPDWRQMLEINLTSAFVVCQAAAPALSAHGRGSIITISSMYGLVGPDWRLYEGTPLANAAAYAGSKGGLIQLTRWLATTLAPRVRANVVSPGGIFRGHEEPFLGRYCARTPLGRMGTEEDVIGAVAYLASDLSAYVTGQNLVVDGGWTAW